jgi:hypothetical protein
MHVHVLCVGVPPAKRNRFSTARPGLGTTIHYNRCVVPVVLHLQSHRNSAVAELQELHNHNVLTCNKHSQKLWYMLWPVGGPQVQYAEQLPHIASRSTNCSPSAVLQVCSNPDSANMLTSSPANLQPILRVCHTMP